MKINFSFLNNFFRQCSAFLKYLYSHFIGRNFFLLVTWCTLFEVCFIFGEKVIINIPALLMSFVLFSCTPHFLSVYYIHAHVL